MMVRRQMGNTGQRLKGEETGERGELEKTREGKETEERVRD